TMTSHHTTEKYYRVTVGGSGQEEKDIGGDCINEPVRKAVQTLALGPYAIRKDFTDENPDDRPLGKREESDIADQQPYEKILVAASEKDGGNASETRRRTHRADQQQCLAADAIDDVHSQHRE